MTTKPRRPAALTEHVPSTIRLASAPEERDGGWVFEAVAQFYEIVNARLLRFEWGSGSKTISERVPAGRVKIHSGHPWDPNHHTIVGKVLEAREDRKAGGLVYRGFLSGAEEGLALKMKEGVVDENSLELIVLREREVEVPIDQIPETSRQWVDISPAGQARIRSVVEWYWSAIGLVSQSAQARRALLEPPSLVPYQDLAIAAAGTPWNQDEARARVSSWAGDGDRGNARLAVAFLARDTRSPYEFAYQVADVVDGELVVVPAALSAVYEEVERLAEDGHGKTAASLARQIGRYEARLGQADLTNPAIVPQSSGDQGEEQQPDGAAADSPETLRQQAAGPGTPTHAKAGDPGDAALAERENDLRELQLKGFTIWGFPGTGGQNVTSHPGTVSARPRNAET